MSLTGKSQCRHTAESVLNRISTRTHTKVTHQIKCTVVGEVGSSPYQIKSQSLVSHSWHDVITAERGHMDGMQRSIPFESNGKAPSGLVTLWSGVRTNSCAICNHHLPQMVLTNHDISGPSVQFASSACDYPVADVLVPWHYGP